MNLLLQIPVAVFLVLGAWFRPQFIDPTLPFGVRVPPERVDDPAVLAVGRRYRAGVLLAACVTAALYALFWQNQANAAMPLLILLALIVLLIADYEVAHFGLRRIKAEQHWYAGQRQAVAAAVGDQPLAERPDYRWALPALLVVAVTAVIGIVRYPLLPDRLATHFAANGTPDAWSARSWGSALIPVWSQAGLTALFGFLAWSVGRTRREVNPADPAGSTLRQNRFRSAAFKLLWALAALVGLSHLLVALVMWQVLPPLGVGTTVLPPLLVLVIAFGFAWRIGQGGSRVPVAGRPAGKGPVARDDDRFWKGGLIYVNRDDPALLVQKRFGMGWTLNLGHPAAWGIVLLLVALILYRKVFAG